MSREIVRFTGGQRVFHWAYFVAFVALAVTGAFLYLPWLSFATGEAGEMSRLIHRLFGAVLLVVPLLALIFSPRAFLRDLREGLTWRAADVKSLWILVTRYYWTGNPSGLPPQGKFTAGQKLNIGMQVLTFFGFGITGILLWLGPAFLPVGVYRWSVILHGVAAVGAICFVLIHIYMATLLPLTSRSIAAIFVGTVSEEYAREHHPRWYERVVR